MEWQKKIESCFKSPGFIFAGDSIAEENAFQLLSELRKNDISWKEVAVGFAQYLLSQRCTPPHIDEQTVRIQDRYLAWLK